jgi:hypothetical protein
MAPDGRTLPRRAVVRAAIAASAGLALWRLLPDVVMDGVRGGWRATVRPASGAGARAIRMRVAALFDAPGPAARIGERYLASLAEPPRTQDLIEATGIDFAENQGRAGLRTAFAAARRRDFAAGEVVVLEGWVLARSEAACCALLARA